ncbi:myogenesis-regulating glycosidase isoform X2 [Atheta coriaria]|uniref:myogenesis-regulating glycosidase isoform X2 n=1 Tax=Dalotia coriaria TaxID=877792 RepID=UPI0031F46CB5
MAQPGTPLLTRKLSDRFYIPDDSDSQSQASDNDIRSDYYGSDNDFSDTEEYVQPVPIAATTNGVPLRHSRRKSITVMPRMSKSMNGINGDDGESGSNSPANSITSVNSLASLLREKMQMLPSQLRRKKPKDYKIRVFVVFLFLTIVFLIVFAYVLYQQKVLQKAYFERVKFNEAKRLMKIFNQDGHEIIRGRLGTTINYDKVYPCLPEDDPGDGSICLEWMQRARLLMQREQLNEDVRCYNLNWMSLTESIDPTDCYDMSNGHWYGGGDNAESAWPLEKAEHDYSPFVTGRVEKHRWSNVLKRYFINSKGVAIVIDDRSPLYLSIKTNKDKKELCMKAKYDDFAFVNRLTDYPQLKYRVCTGSNITKLHLFLSENILWDGLTPDDNQVINSLLTEPLWQITANFKENFTQETVFNYTDNVIGLGFLKQGHVLINEFWQKQIGDYTVDLDRFPTLEETLNIMHRRGFRIVFSVQPFISTESSNFAEAVKKRLLISERYSDRRIPALTRYKSLESAGMLDVSNNRTMPWLIEKLRAINKKYPFHAYYLDLGTAYNLPHYYQCENMLHNPDQYKTQFINNIQGNLNIFGVNSAIERPRAPIFVSLPMVESSWDGLRRVIPSILTYGIIGYPFIIPGAVGGDYYDSHYNLPSDNAVLPDKELYIRWLQLATFLPVIRFTHLPSTYGDEKVLQMAKILTSLRQSVVTPILIQYAKVALDSGMPLIRPLWMLEPNDQACHIVNDEFAIGEDLIVAPMLYSKGRQREVYLPAGVWKDGIDGSLRKGSRWIHDYRIEEDKIAYFERKPDDTRF